MVSANLHMFGRRLALFVLLSFVDGSFMPAQESAPSALPMSEWVFVQPGDLPIIISAPHGGTGQFPGATERTGEGLAKGATGFVTGRDIGTEELARLVAVEVESQFGKKPFVVISLVHRKYLDPNRPREIAYDTPAVRPVYDYYHETLADYCRIATNRFHCGLLIDIHGQGSRRDTVFRGTKNGLTVTHLRDTFGQRAHDGPDSLFGILQNQGWTVHPQPLSAPEQAGFSGGHIVRTYGSHQASPIDAVQLEFGSVYRIASRRGETARTLASAIAEYGRRYLDLPLTEEARTSIAAPKSANDDLPAGPMHGASPSTKVAVFVDEGVSATETLMQVLDADQHILAGKISAAEIRSGALAGYDVLIHPGGSGSAQGKALQEDGRKRVREFLGSGKGLIGICAGAYLATCDYDWSLHVLDAKVIDRQHWNRGAGSVAIEFSDTGLRAFGINDRRSEIQYHQGPLLAPGGIQAIPDYQVMATYSGEIAKKGAPTGVMIGTTAIARGEFEKGRVLCFSPHPEKKPATTKMLIDGIRWAARKEFAAPESKGLP